ncbi:hypothetical protein AAEU28_13835 [Pseudoalteromonas sp. SS15]|uniref:hypothetical protein n=1 Tax=Pseudoalteromonas sp. SS15 TaxID=3139393 RepID=UPI003BA9C4A8
MKIRAILLATSLISSSAFASNINFDYVEAGYATISFDDSRFDPKGVGLKFSKQLEEKFLIKASYIVTTDSDDNDDYELSQLYAGFGYLTYLEEDKIIEVSPYFGKLKTEIEYSYSGGIDKSSYDATIYGLEANYHFAFNKALNMLVGVGYEHLDFEYLSEDNAVYQVQLNYTFAENFTLNFAHRNANDYKNTGLNIRYNF